MHPLQTLTLHAFLESRHSPAAAAVNPTAPATLYSKMSLLDEDMMIQCQCSAVALTPPPPSATTCTCKCLVHAPYRPCTSNECTWSARTFRFIGEKNHKGWSTFLGGTVSSCLRNRRSERDAVVSRNSRPKPSQLPGSDVSRD